MTGIFGHKWVSTYGAEVSETWVRGLIDLGTEDLSRGLRMCLTEAESKRRSGDEDWPPTLGEFRSLCKPVRHACHEPLLSLPKPPLTDEQRAEISAGLRAALKSSDSQEAAHG